MVRRLIVVLRFLLTSAGLAALLMLLAAFTSLPKDISEWLACSNQKPSTDPTFIVVLGGGEVPSSAAFMRTYHAAQLHNKTPEAVLIAMLPTKGDPEKEGVGLIRDELILRGVPRQAIRMISTARNTFEEVLAVREIVSKDELANPLIVVTSETHMRRAVACFKKQGFLQVSPSPARARKTTADLGSNVWLRYRFWQQLGLQIAIVRELIAMGYYRVRGYI